MSCHRRLVPVDTWLTPCRKSSPAKEQPYPTAAPGWYLIDQDNGVDLAGQSQLGPQQIADSLKSGSYLCLENIRSLDAGGKWSAARHDPF